MMGDMQFTAVLAAQQLFQRQRIMRATTIATTAGHFPLR
jgi:hypothetical protein